MTIVTSPTSTSTHGNQTPGLAEPFSPITYMSASSSEQIMGQNTEAALATINAALAAQGIVREAPKNGEHDSSSDYFAQPSGMSSMSPKWAQSEPVLASPIKVTHRWEGSVLYVHDDFFEAKLTSLTDESADVTAEFIIEDLSNDDRSLLRPGASFYVTAILEPRSGGRVRHSSDVRFRRLGRWNEDEIALIKDRAKKRRAALGFEDETG